MSTTTEELVDVLRALSADPSIDGILLQHPVPDHIDERAAFDAISADKDVDGVTSASFAAMALTGGGDSNRVRRVASCACSTPQASNSPESMLSWSAEARYSDCRWECSSCVEAQR